MIVRSKVELQKWLGRGGFLRRPDGGRCPGLWRIEIWRLKIWERACMGSAVVLIGVCG